MNTTGPFITPTLAARRLRDQQFGALGAAPPGAQIEAAVAAKAEPGGIHKYVIPEDGMDPQLAYRIIHDELELNRKPSLNLATFVTTWMDDEARKLATENIDVNLADRAIYPMTTELYQRNIKMIAHLLHADYEPKTRDCCDSASEDDDKSKKRDYIGSGTVGSSGAVMLGLLAHKTRWLEWYDSRVGKKPRDGRVPNLVIGGSYQVCWEKVYKFFDLAGLGTYPNATKKTRCGVGGYDATADPRQRCRIIPLEGDRRVVTARVIKECIEAGIIDDNTIAIGLCLGTTLTGEMDEIVEINQLVKELNDKRVADDEHAYRIPIHVDAAYGGFVVPFTEPHFAWDFRASEVQSINVSNHKFGLVYPGLGTVVFRDTGVVPPYLFTEVDYLGGKIDDYALAFSRASWQVPCQYYNFLRLGRRGYAGVMETIIINATYLANQLENKYSKYFKVLTTRTSDYPTSDLRFPNVVARMKQGVPFTASQLSDRLAQDGWTVPAYTLPKNLENVEVFRMVVKENLSMDMVCRFLESVATAVEEFEELESGGRAPRVHRGPKLLC